MCRVIPMVPPRGSLQVNGNHKMTRESLEIFFNQAYAPDSIPRGILQAVRPNDSHEWTEDEDIKRNKKNVKSFVKEFDEAAKRLATRE